MNQSNANPNESLLVDTSIRVLHVDDDPDFADLTADYVEANSDRIEVETETSPGDALELLTTTNEIDCVVSDYEMPGMDGIELLERVREERPHLPFILFTGKGSEEVASEAISKGVTDYLQKEVGADQYAVLANRIANAVTRRRAETRMRLGYLAMATAREGIGILTEDGHYTYVNPAYAELTGYGRASLIDEHWEMLFRDEDAERVRNEILPTIPDEGLWTGETAIVRGDGEEMMVDHALTFAQDGSIICLIRPADDN